MPLIQSHITSESIDTVLELPAKKIRVGMILDQPFPHDSRVEREAVTLVKSGYAVHLLCVYPDNSVLQAKSLKTADKTFKAEEVSHYRGITVHWVNPNQVSVQLPLIKKPTKLLHQGLFKTLFYRLKAIDTVWHTLIHRFVQQAGIQILHVHDLRLAVTCQNIAGYYQLPCIVDLHENYPALMALLKGKRDAQKGLRAQKRWEAIENRCLQEVTHAITVAPEAKKRLVEKGIASEKITVIENTVDMAKFLAAPVNQEIVRQFKPYFVLTYVGHINNMHRGIHTIIEALALLRREIPEIRFIAAGAARPEYLEDLEARVRFHHLDALVHFTGPIDEMDFVSYIEASDICICPHLANPHTNATFPNKVYLYNLFKKPVIASDAVPLKRYIENTGGGLTYPSGRVEELAKIIRHLHQRSDLRRELGQNGHKAVLESYNWQYTAGDLLALYKAISNRTVAAATHSD
ncbi:MAG: glycosyltransferase family 4 protein [Cyanobacteria bacterium P01_H01_bin.74]